MSRGYFVGRKSCATLASLYLEDCRRIGFPRGASFFCIHPGCHSRPTNPTLLLLGGDSMKGYCSTGVLVQRLAAIPHIMEHDCAA